MKTRFLMILTRYTSFLLPILLTSRSRQYNFPQFPPLLFFIHLTLLILLHLVEGKNRSRTPRQRQQLILL